MQKCILKLNIVYGNQNLLEKIDVYIDDSKFKKEYLIEQLGVSRMKVTWTRKADTSFIGIVLTKRIRRNHFPDKYL